MLTELELYDNQITVIENLEALVNLKLVNDEINLSFVYFVFCERFNVSTVDRMLDLAFNRITEIKGLDTLVNLEKLFLSSNKISKVENLENLKSLELLELGDNKIRVSLYMLVCYYY